MSSNWFDIQQRACLFGEPNTKQQEDDKMRAQMCACVEHCRVSSGGKTWKAFPRKNAVAFLYPELYPRFQFAKCDVCTEMAQAAFAKQEAEK